MMRSINIGVFLIFLTCTGAFSAMAKEKGNVTSRENFAMTDKKSRADAEKWLDEHPAPETCPSGFHPESGYWYEGKKYFAWSECTPDGYHRDISGDIKKNST